jgi:hypothetical protein
MTFFRFQTLPDYIPGIGTPEDSLASCYNLVPKAPKKDIVTYLVNANKTLRYGCILDPHEKDRKFILSYNLSDGTIQIVELAVPNSGIAGGKFLSNRKIVHPLSNPKKPEYYTPKDLYIGALLKVFATRFIITSADLYVYRYMMSHPELFSSEIIENVRMYHLLEGNLRDDLKAAIRKDHEHYLADAAGKNVGEAIQDAVSEPIMTGLDRVPSPYTGEEEVKKNYHEKDHRSSNIPCNINIKEEETIPADKGKVRFLEPHEEKQ